MSGQKGMKHFGNAIIEKVLRLREEGKSYREIAKLFGLRNAGASKNLIKCHHQKEERLKLGILPNKVGRKPKKPEALEEENQRLKKENEILQQVQEGGEISVDCGAKRNGTPNHFYARFSTFPEIVIIAFLKESLLWFPSLKVARGKYGHWRIKL